MTWKRTVGWLLALACCATTVGADEFGVVGYWSLSMDSGEHVFGIGAQPTLAGGIDRDAGAHLTLDAAGTTKGMSINGTPMVRPTMLYADGTDDHAAAVDWYQVAAVVVGAAVGPGELHAAGDGSGDAGGRH